MLSLFPVLIDCDCVETVLFELMITCTGRWLTYFVILFLYTRLLSFPRLLSTGLLLLLSKSYMQFCDSWKRLALTESLFFWRLKNLDFLYFAVSVPCFNQLRLWWNCASWIDGTCTGLWLTCFVILFLYTRLLRFPQLLSTGLLLLLSKSYMLFCASRKRLALTQSLIFCRFKNLDFLYFAVFVSCFNRLRLWWNCAFWIDDNMHWALIDLFCDTLFVYKTIEFSAVALDWLATSAFKKLNAILCLNETLGFDWVFDFLEI